MVELGLESRLKLELLELGLSDGIGGALVGWTFDCVLWVG